MISFVSKLLEGNFTRGSRRHNSDAQFRRIPCPLQPRKDADHGRCSRQDMNEYLKAKIIDIEFFYY
jgi:hypothetical protein